MRLHIPASAALMLCMARGVPAHAQEQRPFRLDVGATLAHVGEPLDGFIGATTFGAAIDAFARGPSGGGVHARLIVPIGVTAAIPSCIAGTECPEYRSPNVLYGAGVYGYRLAAGRALRLSLGLGWLHASGARGDDATNTGTIEGGLHYAPRRARGLAPVFGISLLRGLRSVGGVQTLVLPSVGVRF